MRAGNEEKESVHAFLVFGDKSEDVIKTDFALYRNTVIKTPMSKDSKEYKDFMKIYNEETEEGLL